MSRKAIDLTGNIYGKLQVIKRGANDRSGKPQWDCLCECGNIKLVSSVTLKRNNTTCCGCSKKSPRLIDLTGQVFGSLSVLSQAKNSKAGQTRWNCVCICGKKHIVQSTNLKSGSVRSCGCSYRNKPEDLTGQKFNSLTAVELCESNSDAKWLCKCACGKYTKVFANNLKKGHSKSCGCTCLLSEEDLVGFKKGKLTVNRLESSKDIFSRWLWECSCDCGSILTRTSKELISGDTKSCGCLKIEASTTHGMTNTSEYNIWCTMKERCGNPNSHKYLDYGGRGITVCDRWKNSFKNFYEDIGPRPSKKHSIDRIDNDGNYEPTNCRWATAKQQANNKRPRRKKSSPISG